jgi:hypothetical protein
MNASCLFFYPLMLIGGTKTMHHHIVQKILPIILESLPRDGVDLSIWPSSSTNPFHILTNIVPCFSHEKIKEVSHNNAEKFLYRPGNKGGTELKEKKINKPVQRLGVTFFHPFILPPEVFFEKTEERPHT